MNLYFRLLWLFCKIKGNKTQQPLLDTVDIDFRAWPLDCDINLHLTNSRYLALMDIARTWMTARLGLLRAVMKRRWFPVVNATAITYIRDVKPWQKFTVSTRLVGWDHKYFYIEQKFTSHRGLHAIAYVRGVFRSRKGVVDIEEILALADFNDEAPILPPEIMHWKAMLEQKKATNKN
ncbi:thioesterase [Pseudoalteromonas ruthenica]|uniref:thioesterase family protein n=1 Tax=Pseudoalteromonas ruthenica TaxID=151081 RepID=UPI001109DA7C|nr:thioesterase family protein [Pseudoalteromonas ruthenica]TLX50987.1 thioesterase [Pseudoalteromonas ruthenica]